MSVFMGGSLLILSQILPRPCNNFIPAVVWHLREGMGAIPEDMPRLVQFEPVL